MEEYYKQDHMPFKECWDINVVRALIAAKVGEWKYVAEIRMDKTKLLNAIALFVSVSGEHIQVKNDYSAFRKIAPFSKEWNFLIEKDLQL